MVKQWERTMIEQQALLEQWLGANSLKVASRPCPNCLVRCFLHCDQAIDDVFTKGFLENGTSYCSNLTNAL